MLFYFVSIASGSLQTNVCFFLVAGVGFFIALPSRIVEICVWHSTHFISPCFVGYRCAKTAHCAVFACLPTPSDRERSEGVVAQISACRHKTKNQPRGLVFCFMVAGVGFEPHDLRVMSPTSYQAALPRDIWCRKPGSNRYEM